MEMVKRIKTRETTATDPTEGDPKGGVLNGVGDKLCTTLFPFRFADRKKGRTFRDGEEFDGWFHPAPYRGHTFLFFIATS